MRTRSRSITLLHRELVTQGMTFADLARKCGLNIRTVYNIASRNNRTRSGRAKVESALGKRLWVTIPTGKEMSRGFLDPELYARYRAQLHTASKAENKTTSHADL